MHHTVSTACAGTANCNTTIPSTGTGHALVQMATIYHSTNFPAYQSASGAGTWSNCAACRVQQTFNIVTIVAYNLSTTAGVTSVNLTLDASADQFDVDVYELAWSGASITYDTGNATSITSACTSCAGPTLTLGGTTDVILQEILPNFSCTAISGAYASSFEASANGDAWAISLNTSSGTAPTWTCTSGVAVVSAIALKGN